MPVAKRLPILLSGETVEDRYRVLRIVAEGGMATVFLAEHMMIRRRVAIKVLHAELAASAEMTQRFMDEARAAGMLGHPNIVVSTDMGHTRGGVPFIVFEYLEGAVLSEEIQRVHGLPVRRALRIAMQIASALDTAHQADIVHLDLKSDNVILTDSSGVPDHVKVLDFGISKFLRPEPERTERQIMLGTPAYMAPEQIATPDLVDRRADVYALGVLLYEMLTARRPFAGTVRVLLHRILDEPPAPLDRPQVPPELEQLVMRMLAKAPADRPQSMDEVHAALVAIGERPSAVEVIAPAPPPTLPPPSVRGWLIAAAICVLAATGLLAAFSVAG
jgi:serine/threonine protein kinase